MDAGLILREQLGAFGEFRAYRHGAAGAELAFEILREADGRACMLRLPMAERTNAARLLRKLLPALASGATIEVDPQGTAELDQVALGPSDQLVAMLMVENDAQALALWRREHLREGWSWTIDFVAAPIGHAAAVCERMLGVLEQPAPTG